MKICSECQRCYDDSIANCAVEDHKVLTDARPGNCTLVEGYKIDAQIESDSPVELFRATHPASKKSVLIRIIKAGNSNGELRDQLQLYANINHENLARVFEFGSIGQEEVYVVSEHIEGQTLRERLNETGKFAEKQAIIVARQIAEGLEKLHNTGLLHRNLNPANIYLVDKENENLKVKLNYPDFCGIIERNVAIDANGINAQTEVFEYFSPEQFLDNTIDFKTDLYSLAVVFYEMLLGRTPYDLLSPQAIKEYIFNSDDVDGLNHDLRGLIAYSLRESLQQRLSLRPRTTNVFVRQLRHLELVATPKEFIGDEELPNQQKWSEQQQRGLIKESFLEKEKPLRSSHSDNFDEVITANITADGELKVPESVDELDEIYLTDENSKERFAPILTKNENIYEDELIDDSIEQNLPEIPIRTNSKSGNATANAYTFKKGHVYTAGALAIILFGSFFLMTFYNWQSTFSAAKAGLTEGQVNTENSARSKDAENSEDTEPRQNGVTEAENSSQLVMRARENFLRARAEKQGVSSNEDSAKEDLSINNKTGIKKPKKIVKRSTNKKQPIVGKNVEKKLFEDTVIIVGDKPKNAKNQNKMEKNNAGGKDSKVFSDVVIYY